MKLLLAAAVAAFAIVPAQAQDTDVEVVREKLSSFLGPSFPIEEIAGTDMSGVFEVTARGQVLYVSVKDNLVLVGRMFDAERGVNLGEEKQNQIASELARKALEGMSIDDMVVFSGAETKRHITVFTDMDCGYCRRLHQEVPELNAAGVEVRYLMFPAISQQSFPKAVTVWCSENKQETLTRAKLGEELDSLSCDNPVQQQLELGRSIGVQGTPYIIVDDYSVIPGYVPAKDLIAQLGLGG